MHPLSHPPPDAQNWLQSSSVSHSLQIVTKQGQPSTDTTWVPVFALPGSTESQIPIEQWMSEQKLREKHHQNTRKHLLETPRYRSPSMICAISQCTAPSHETVGSLGHFEKEAIATLHAIFQNLTRNTIPRLLLELSKITVGYSSHIFHARRSATWNLNTRLIRLFLM